MFAAQLLAVVVAAAPADPSPAAPARIDLPEPRPVPRVTLTEAPRRPYYGLSRRRVSLGFRLGLGLGARLAGQRSDTAHFALDGLLFARAGLHRGRNQAALFPTIGYSLGAGKFTREHLLLAGLGLGFIGKDDAGIAVVPALVVGAAERQLVLGVRTSLLLDVGRLGLVPEIAHQYLDLPTGPRHELRLMFGMDLIRIFKAR
ncbi:hypothetical protein [Nannocystis bainbridge]|uniref:Outer membrane protein beta-barrel domain-containing protein n=1 Tax=Nannocystis bainbridge TaxID=2995303 RepID=A0ABT5EAG9_9BACT|nr:hypothetical protein [Nannocystis bainbridge]MDC0722849.1 hypothetical protein [Nannocystis bainbridge]